MVLVIDVGATTDFSIRLREHNGELAGGAKSTQNGRPWIPVALVSGFPTWEATLTFESQLRRGKMRNHSRNRKKGNRPNILTRLNFLIKQLELNENLHIDVNPEISEMEELKICKPQLQQIEKLINLRKKVAESLTSSG